MRAKRSDVNGLIGIPQMCSGTAKDNGNLNRQTGSELSTTADKFHPNSYSPYSSLPMRVFPRPPNLR